MLSPNHAVGRWPLTGPYVAPSLFRDLHPCLPVRESFAQKSAPRTLEPLLWEVGFVQTPWVLWRDRVRIPCGCCVHAILSFAFTSLYLSLVPQANCGTALISSLGKRRTLWIQITAEKRLLFSSDWIKRKSLNPICRFCSGVYFLMAVALIHSLSCTLTLGSFPPPVLHHHQALRVFEPLWVDLDHVPLQGFQPYSLC